MKRLVAGSVLLLAAWGLPGATYNGIQTVSTVVNEANAATYAGSSGTNNLLAVTATGGLTTSASLNVGYNTAWSATDVHGRLVFDGGVYNTDVYDGRKTANIGYGGLGWLTVNGGSVYLGQVMAGRGTVAKPAYAEITVNSGLLDVQPPAGAVNCAHLAYNAYSGQCVTTAKVVQTGGTIRWRGRGTTYVPFFMGYQNAQTFGMYIVSGGTTIFGHHVFLGGATTGKGHFEVRGSAGTVWAGSTTNRWYTYEGKSTMAFVLDDSPGHISCIDIYYQQTDAGWGATIDLALDGYTPTTGEVFDLVRDRDGSISIAKWVLAADDQEDWMLQRNTAGDTMQAVYVKEPVVPGGTVVLVL